MSEKDRPRESKIGQRRVMTTWAVGEAWERFCLGRQEVIKHSFTAVRLSLPIDGSRDKEMSFKGMDMVKLVEDLQNWTIGGLEQPTLDIESNSDREESLPSDDGNDEFISYEPGPLREEANELEEGEDGDLG